MGQMVLLMDGMRQARHGQAYFTDRYVFTPLYQSVKQHRIYATKSPFPRQAAFLEGVAYWGGHEVGWQAKVSRWYSWSGGGGGVRGGKGHPRVPTRLASLHLKRVIREGYMYAYIYIHCIIQYSPLASTKCATLYTIQIKLAPHMQHGNR